MAGTGPTETTRPPQTPAENGVATAIVANIATIATYILATYALPAELPGNVRAAVDAITLSAVAFAVAFVAARMRNAQWSAEGQVTGAKRLL